MARRLITLALAAYTPLSSATNPAELMRFQGNAQGNAQGVAGPFDGDRAPPMTPGRLPPTGDDDLAESFRFAEQAGRGGAGPEEAGQQMQGQQLQRSENGEVAFDDEAGAARRRVIDYERSKGGGRATRGRDPPPTPPTMMRFQEARVKDEAAEPGQDDEAAEEADDAATEALNPDTDPDAVQAAADAEEAAPADTAPLTTAEIAALRASGKSDSEIAVEQAKRKLTADKIAKASAALDAAETTQANEEQKAQDAEAKLQNAAERTAEAGAGGALSTSEKAQMQAAIEKAGAQQQANIAASRERQAVKGELLKDIKKEAEAQAEVEAADFADMSPEQILATDKMDREQQFLTQLTPNAIRAAEVELSSVFSSVIGSLLTNMLTREPDLVARHMGVPTKKAGRR